MPRQPRATHLWGLFRLSGERHRGFPDNVARNSPVNLSSIEIGALQFQRLSGVFKTDWQELRATFGVWLQHALERGYNARSWPSIRVACAAAAHSTQGIGGSSSAPYAADLPGA